MNKKNSSQFLAMFLWFFTISMIILPVKSQVIRESISLLTTSGNKELLAGSLLVGALGIAGWYYYSSLQTSRNLIIQAEAQSKRLSFIDDETKYNLYAWGDNYLLTKEEDTTIENSEQLQKIFESNNISTTKCQSVFYTIPVSQKWQQEDFQKAYEVLTNRSKEIEIQENDNFNIILQHLPKIHIAKIPTLLKSAKIIIKDLLLPDDYTINESSLFKKKWSFKRMFAYVHLINLIKKHELSNIKVLFKFIRIQKKDDNSYLNYQEAQQVIESMITICVAIPSKLLIFLSYCEDSYAFRMFAHKQETTKVPMNPQAQKQLEFLLSHKGTLDIGFDNISTTPTGDAVIIDYN